ncbi:ABC transporter permease [Clostridium psychrophilum]|uniref:ABC transporter permease n=1 Tax=Clostridium psychrophilum TaxID=132926 RepID=UPI001C0E6C1B|nr:ABC transporter permease [Clostridium psychrophilum]MBU3180920.1 ABC transporter permease [Clostridium psychrophilum]
MKKYINTENKFIPILFQLIILFIWQIAIDKWKVPQYILPSPKDIIITLVDILPNITNHIYATIYEALFGFIISILFSLLLAILMDNVKIIKKCIYPILVVSQTVPIIALAPLFIIWFGFGILPKVIVVVLVCFFPIVISLVDGLESADLDMVNLLKTMGASRLQIFTMVKLPSSTVNLFSGLRIAATYSIMGAVIGEWLGGDKGLGVYMIRAKNSYELDKVFAVIVIIVILSMTLFGLLYLLQYIFTPWTRNSINNNKQN